MNDLEFLDDRLRVTTVLGFRISHDTLLRVLRRVPIPCSCAEIIGIDDFVFKKGHPVRDHHL